jgi:hypothetical protein
MFEKEAEESFMCKKVLYKWETDKRSYIGGFSDGAEFGYNKANEWHKVSDKLPPSGETVLLHYGTDVMGKVVMSTGCVDCKGNWYKNVEEEPIQWKEIVLPKESE